MSTFIGEYDLTVDAKGRFLLPAGFRRQLSESEALTFVISRGFENCLNLYPLKEWESIIEKLNKLNDFNPRVRDFKRVFMNGANIIDSDTAGRLLIPKNLIEHAGILKDITLTAQGNKLEIWDTAKYKQYIQNQTSGFSDLANEVLGNGFINPFENI